MASVFHTFVFFLTKELTFLIFLTSVAAAIGIFTLLKTLRFHQAKKENNCSSLSYPSSSSSPSSPPSSLSLPCPPSSSSPPSSLSLPCPPSSSSLSCFPSPSSTPSRNWDHDVFPSFHGPDVRIGFLSHMLKEVINKGIKPFIDNNIDRSKSIDLELKRAISGSKIAIVLLSKNYASSSWCLDELVEIMKCRDLGQIVVPIFYEVDPTDVKKQAGDFGKAFEKTCSQGKTKEKIETWRKTLEGVAPIAGYHLKNWDSEAAMVGDITNEILKILNQLAPSCDFERYIGMGDHIEKVTSLLRLDSDDVRMIGIWGPPGIGKTAIATFMFNKLFNSFHWKANMEKIKECYPRPNEHNTRLQLQKQMLSQMHNHKDMEITNLSVSLERLKHKRVLLVVDDVDKVAQLDVLAENIKWFGPGSRIIITTQDVGVLRKHGIQDIYTVDFPSDDEALQIFCMTAFGQKYPKDGFKELARQIVSYAGKLPIGLKVMGSYFKNMSKEEWKKAKPKLWRSLDGEIGSILQFSYDALDSVEKDIFLHLACLFNGEKTEYVKEYLVKRFRNVSHNLDILAEKSLIFFKRGNVRMPDLLVKFGKEIVSKQSPEKRKFLIDSAKTTCDVLSGDRAGSENVIGINFYDTKLDARGSKLNISERAFEGMSNLQFLKIHTRDNMHLPRGLSYLSSKLRLLDWERSPVTCLPSNVNMKFLVKLNMSWSKLEKLWVGIKPLPNLKWMHLMYSTNLKELPDLSTATKLKELELTGCSSLVELPDLPTANELQELIITECSSLVKLPSSVGNLHELEFLHMVGCSKVEVLPINVNLKSLDVLNLRACSSLKIFPEISTNITVLVLRGTAIEEVPSPTRSCPHLMKLDMSHCKNLKKFAHALDRRDTKIQDVSPFVQGFPRLYRLKLKGCKELLSLPQLSDSLAVVDARNCESLERLECSFRNPDIELNFSNCFKLNKEARDLIIQTSAHSITVLPGKEIPAYFSHRDTGGSLIVKLNERPFPSTFKFKACILLVNKNEVEDNDEEERSLELPSEPEVFCLMKAGDVFCSIIEEHYWIVRDRLQGRISPYSVNAAFSIRISLTQHLYIYECTAEVTSDELLFTFIVDPPYCKVKECGIVEVEDNEGDSSDEDEGFSFDTSRLVRQYPFPVEDNEGDSLDEEEEENESGSSDEEEEYESDTVDEEE